ncbi:hypothetical protein DPMN_013095 [Dreissena polymorpha]|uniref:Uncharacterized protein n=1 Tax=Dreissena polymorpha TaxID=45954 RepID=A0A9D4N999_DREPO|nr:hypothetical protein DPMN_013095 [Dreissena polymorpha]
MVIVICRPSDPMADFPSPLRKLPLPLGIEDVGSESPMAMESSCCATETNPGPSAKTYLQRSSPLLVSQYKLPP